MVAFIQHLENVTIRRHVTRKRSEVPNSDDQRGAIYIAFRSLDDLYENEYVREIGLFYFL